MSKLIEYQKRVKHNTRLAKEALRLNGINGLLSILGQIYTFESEPGEIHITQLIRGAYDLVPALMLGYLPSLEHGGTDAIEIVDGEIIEIEFKWATFKSTLVWKSPKGTLYTGKEDTAARRAGFRSCISGKFVVHTEDCLHSKKRKTILLVSDSDNANYLLIDAFELQPEIIFEYLSGTNNRGEERKTPSRDIKLSTFVNHGMSVKDKFFGDDGIRLNDYEGAMREHSPLYEVWKAGKRVEFTA